MRPLILSAVTLLALPGFAAEQASALAPVSEVVLYPGGATLVRQVQVSPGTSQITIPGLPSHFDLQTLRTDAPAGVRIGEIVSRDTTGEQARSPAEAELENRIQALTDQKMLLDADQLSAMTVKSYLDRIGGGDKAGSPTDPKQLATLLDAIGRGAGDAMRKVQRLTMEKRDLDKKIVALQGDLARLRTGEHDARMLIVNVVADRSAQIRLSYQVQQAGWKPAYRASLDSATAKLGLDRLATVSQKTGEDWNNVKLKLSTNQPNRSPAAVEPQPWLLRWYEQRHAEITGSSVMARSALMAAPPPKLAQADEIHAYTPPTFETQSEFSTEFEVPGRITLPSDGREVSVPLNHQNLPVKLLARTTPRIDTRATVVAQTDKPSGVWLRGNLQLVRDGNYIGVMAWDPNAKSAFELPFGNDDRVRVEKHSLLGDSGKGGIFNQKNERRIADEYVITNLHAGPVTLQVLEPSPVSTADQIKVQTTFEPKPDHDSWEQKRGVVGWDKTLGTGGAMKVRVDYTINFPQDGTVVGLPN